MKKNTNLVDPMLVDIAIKKAKYLQSVYSECVRASYKFYGRLDCGFTAKEMVDWINENRPNIFDDKGKKYSNENHS